nr:DUF2206 domain-containing protein [uncultured Methanobacterium sp.]
MLIVSLLRLNKLNFTEKFVLSWGISLAFVTLLGLLINNIVLLSGHTNALSLNLLLFSFNLSILALTIANYFYNKESSYTIPSLSFNKLEWTIIISSFYLVLMSIAGVLLLENTGNNIILMLLFLVIALYVSLITIFRNKFPKKLYPLVIFFIGLSILMIMSLRSSHIMGVDIHAEYNIFYNTLINGYWKISGHSTVADACITISLLPAIYQKILSVDPEVLFKFLFISFFSISTVIIYLISNKYVKKDYAFLAAFFFMSQLSFFTAETNPRTNMAVLFVMMGLLVFFNERMALPKKRLLFIIFLISCVLSHYSTTYIFFIILFLSLLVNYLSKRVNKVSKNYSIETLTSTNLIVLFFSIMFLWYAQITQEAFGSGVGFFRKTFTNLFVSFFVSESRGSQVQALAGQGILQKAISSQVEFVFTWLILGCIGLGILSVFIYRKKILFAGNPEINMLKRNIDFEFYVMAFISTIILAAMVILPYVAQGYSMDRLYLLTSAFLSIFFVIGASVISNVLGKLKNIKIGRDLLLINNASSNKSFYLILLILVPYFLCVSGFTYNILGENKSVLSNSNVDSYYESYITDGESFGAKWLGEYKSSTLKIRADHTGAYRLYSQGNRPFESVDEAILKKSDNIKGYIYLRSRNIFKGIFVWNQNKKEINSTLYDSYYDTIYDSGDSRILLNQ